MNDISTTIYVPKKIKVGFNNRNDTYTGKLAYIIYYDEKGKLRKETSWNSWRDKSIDPEEYDNEPTSGFVLNKKVGDYSGSWGNHRPFLLTTGGGIAEICGRSWISAIDFFNKLG